jgi:hypothetical protein
MQLGFFIGGTILSAIWCIDWRHYIRYYVGLRPYSNRAQFIARSFFLACFLGSLVSVAMEILDSRPTIQWLGYSLMDSLLLLGAFFALDLPFRWWWGRRNN